MKKNKKELELVRQILTQAIEISSNSVIDVFVNYSGHVDYIGIQVYLQGWNVDIKADYKVDIWFGIDKKEHCYKQLKEAVKYLKSLKTDNFSINFIVLFLIY